jgi:anthranilate synthase
VHTLANYVRQVGAEVRTVRAPMQPGELEQYLDSYQPDLLLLSPGPGRPEDFGVAKAAEAAIQAGVAVFGVCLGLQGIVERFGGRLGLLSYPMHGKASQVRIVDAGGLMAGLPDTFEAGRYHSIFADRATLPAELAVTAETEDGVIMAVEHRTLPVAAVQFHPESIMTASGNVGLRLIHNVITRLASRTSRPVGAEAGS